MDEEVYKVACNRVGCEEEATHTVILFGCSDGEVPVCEPHADEEMEDGGCWPKHPITQEFAKKWREVEIRRILEELEDMRKLPPEITEEEQIPYGTKVRVIKVVNIPNGLSPVVGTEGVVVPPDGASLSYIWVEFQVPPEGLRDNNGGIWEYWDEKPTMVVGFRPDQIEIVKED